MLVQAGTLLNIIISLILLNVLLNMYYMVVNIIAVRAGKTLLLLHSLHIHDSNAAFLNKGNKALANNLIIT